MMKLVTNGTHIFPNSHNGSDGIINNDNILRQLMSNILIALLIFTLSSFLFTNLFHN